MYIGNVMLLILNLPLVPVFASLVKIPPRILMPIVAVISFCGAYSMNNSSFDLWLLILFAVVGTVMKIAGFDAAPLIVGLVLGPEMESSLRRSLVMSKGSFMSVVTRPISGTILLIAVIYLVFSAVGKYRKKNRKTCEKGETT